MQDKLDIYDVLGILVPGVLAVCTIPLAFPGLAVALGASHLPGEFAFVGLIAASIFIGYLIQAVASLIEGVLNKTWGGRPSELALEGKLPDRYLPAETAARIRNRLLAVVGTAASNRSLFLHAMQRAESSGNPRVSRFNALYAYHRALVVLNVVTLVLFVFSFWGGIAAHFGWKQNVAIFLVLMLLLTIMWHRTKQRGFYYVREVLMTAAQILTPPDLIDSTERR